MSIEEIEEYFEELATKFRPIGHTTAAPRYCRFNIEELLSGFVHKLDLSKFCLLLESPMGALEDNGGDGYFDNQEIAFLVIRRCELRNFAQEKQILADTRRLGLQIVARIIEDGRFIDLDENTIEYEKVGSEKVLANCYGYRFTFTASSTIDLSTDPALWNE